jgi:hypothetical protein
MGKVTPKKESYARFLAGTISDTLELHIQDGNNRDYAMDLSALFADHFLDFGIYINNFDKAIN